MESSVNTAFLVRPLHKYTAALPGMQAFPRGILRAGRVDHNYDWLDSLIPEAGKDFNAGR